MKKKIIIFLTLLLFTGCGVNKNNENNDAIKFKNEYESLNGKMNEHTNKENRKLSIPEDNPIVYSSAKEINELIKNKETFLVYFGFSSCPWCRSVIETLLDAADNLGLKEIYYVDVQNIRDIKKINEDGKIITDKKGTKDYYELLDNLNDVLENYDLGENVSSNEKRIYAPNIVSVVNGKPIEMTSGTSEKETDPFMKLNDEMISDSYKMFKCAIECIVKENSCNKDTMC